MSDADPIESLLARLPGPLRSTVEAARDGGDWGPARRAIVAAGRARPGPHHVVYGRLLLALDDFDGCRSILDRVDPAVLDDPAELVDLRAELRLEEAATAWWSPVPGRPDQRVPTSATAVEAVRAAIEDAKALGPTSPWTRSQIEAFERTVAWAAGSARVGGLVGPLGAVVAGLLLGLHGLRHGGGAWLGAALTWLAAAPLLVWAGTRPQWQVNASVVEGRQSLDDLALATLAKAPPHFAPLGLALRLAIHAAIAPFAVLWRSLDGRKPLPALALGVAAVWGFVAAPELALPAPEEAPVEAGGGPIFVAGQPWALGSPAGGTEPIVQDGVEVRPILVDDRLTGLVVVSEGTEAPGVELPGWTAGLESLLSPENSACRVTLRRFDAGEERTSLRTTSCPVEGGRAWTIEVQLR